MLSTAERAVDSVRGTALNTSKRATGSRTTPTPLRDHVAAAVRGYLQDLDGSDADDLHALVLREMEIPLFTEVLRHCDGNQSRAADMLGLHRATLRKKLRDYGIA